MHWVDSEGNLIPVSEDKTGPTFTGSWMSKPVSVPWPILLALLGFGGGGLGGMGIGFISKDDVITKDEFEAWTKEHAELHKGLSDDIEDISDDLEDVSEDLKELDQFFKRVPVFNGDPR